MLGRGPNLAEELWEMLGHIDDIEGGLAGI